VEAVVDETATGIGDEADENTQGRVLGPRPEDDPGQGVVQAFGRMLELMRIRAGIQRDVFGGQLGYSASSIASFEQGRRIPSPKFIDQADKILDAGGVLAALKGEVARAQSRTAWDGFVTSA
jgi:ribosome-binding protein aMBF1 (putative translation factor)